MFSFTHTEYCNFLCKGYNNSDKVLCKEVLILKSNSFQMSQIAVKIVQLNNPILKLLKFNKDFFPAGSSCNVVFSLKTCKFSSALES